MRVNYWLLLVPLIAVQAYATGEVDMDAKPHRSIRVLQRERQAKSRELEMQNTEGENQESGSTSDDSDKTMMIIILSSIGAGLGIVGISHCLGWPCCPCMRGAQQGRVCGCEPIRVGGW